MSRAEIYYKFDLNFQNMSIINILYFEYECEQNTKLLNDKKKKSFKPVVKITQVKLGKLQYRAKVNLFQ